MLGGTLKWHGDNRLRRLWGWWYTTISWEMLRGDIVNWKMHWIRCAATSCGWNKTWRRTDVSVKSAWEESLDEVSAQGEDRGKVDQAAVRAVVKIGANKGEGEPWAWRCKNKSLTRQQWLTKSVVNQYICSTLPIMRPFNTPGGWQKWGGKYTSHGWQKTQWHTWVQLGCPWWCH